MRLDPTLSETDMVRRLRQEAAEAYGPMRTFELSGAIESTAAALTLIAQAPLDLTDDAPDTSGIDDGGVA